MCDLQRTRTSWRLAAVLLIGVPGSLSLPVAADDAGSGDRVFVETGIPSTGFNRALGQPIWSYPNLEPFVPIFGAGVRLIGFRTAGAFDPAIGDGGGNSPPLSPAAPPQTLLASHLDELGLSFVGVDPASIPASVLNVRLDDAEILVDEFGVRRERVPCATDATDAAAITRAAPCGDALTLGQWMEARGLAVMRCRGDGSATVTAWMRNLRPNRLYTAWYITENFDAGPLFFLSAIPFGGVPNVFVTDGAGRATFKRDLGFCPHDQTQALGVAVVMRSNGQNYGGVPVPFLNQEDPFTAFEGFAGLVPGSVAHVHLSFNLGGVPFTLPPGAG